MYTTNYSNFDTYKVYIFSIVWDIFLKKQDNHRFPSTIIISCSLQGILHYIYIHYTFKRFKNRWWNIFQSFQRISQLYYYIIPWVCNNSLLVYFIIIDNNFCWKPRHFKITPNPAQKILIRWRTDMNKSPWIIFFIIIYRAGQ